MLPVFAVAMFTPRARSTLSGGQKRWKEEKAQQGDGRVIVIHGDAAGAAEEDEAEQ